MQSVRVHPGGELDAEPQEGANGRACVDEVRDVPRLLHGHLPLPDGRVVIEQVGVRLRGETARRLCAGDCLSSRRVLLLRGCVQVFIVSQKSFANSMILGARDVEARF